MYGRGGWVFGLLDETIGLLCESPGRASISGQYLLRFLYPDINTAMSIDGKVLSFKSSYLEADNFHCLGSYLVFSRAST
jgi:hypothetical protein